MTRNKVSINGIMQWSGRRIIDANIAARAIGAPKVFAHSLRLLNIHYSGSPPQSSFSASPFKYGCRAAACISIDFDHCITNPEKNSLIHQGTISLIELAEQYDIPLTWAICGKTALEYREAYRSILDANVKQDVGVHTFSHRDMSDSKCSEIEVKEEISRCLEVMERKTRPRTFIFPKNREGHFSTLKSLGFTAFRQNKPTLGYPIKVDGLWAIPAIYFVNTKSANNLKKIKSLFNLSVEYGSVFHIWSHPWSLSIDENVEIFVRTTLEPLFQYISEKRNEGLIWLATINELANYCEARSSLKTTHKYEEGSLYLSANCSIYDKRYDTPTEATIVIPLQNEKFEVKVNGRTVTKENIRTSESKHVLELFLTLTFNEPEKHIEVKFC